MLTGAMGVSLAAVGRGERRWGVMKYANGDEYRGDFLDDQRHGKGTVYV